MAGAGWLVVNVMSISCKMLFMIGISLKNFLLFGKGWSILEFLFWMIWEFLFWLIWLIHCFCRCCSKVVGLSYVRHEFNKLSRGVEGVAPFTCAVVTWEGMMVVVESIASIETILFSVG